MPYWCNGGIVSCYTVLLYSVGIAASVLFGTVVGMLDALAGDGWLTHREAVDTFVMCPCITRPSHCVTTNKSEVQTAELLSVTQHSGWACFTSAQYMEKSLQIFCIMIYCIHFELHIHFSAIIHIFLPELYNYAALPVGKFSEKVLPMQLLSFSTFFLFFPEEHDVSRTYFSWIVNQGYYHSNEIH